MPTPPELASPSGKSLTTFAFERLRADILCGRLKPDERLRIQALSRQYEVGATAIREALSRLVTEDLVVSEDQRGFCVAPVSRADLIDLTQTRVDLECLALRRAIENGDVEWESALLSALHRLARTPPPTTDERHEPWAQAHRQFHEALIAGCGSPWLIRLCRLLHEKSERYRNLAEHQTRPASRDPDTEHREVMDATMARDADKACALLSQHFQRTSDIILRASFGQARPAKTKSAGSALPKRPGARAVRTALR